MTTTAERWLCPQLAKLQGEMARTKRRAELQVIIDNATDVLGTHCRGEDG
jgi:hypothetical protein